MTTTAPPGLSRTGNEVVTAARLLAADAVEAAQSGHPGAAISLAPVATLLYGKYIRHDPQDPHWFGRDRFILSCGHASMLLYAQLYLTGYDLSLDDLKNFRRLGSKTPGHPEYGITPGVDATTGPLGQGFAMGVGMAMAFAHQRALYDAEAPTGDSPFDRHVWVLASDGDLEEGISYEAGSLAGRHQLDNLTVLYDRNRIQIDGATDLAWSEDVVARFEAQGWRVSTVARASDGDIDITALDDILSAGGDHRPHLVVLDSEIAWPSPTARGTAGSHGAPLGAEEVAGLRRELGVDTAPFDVPDAVLDTAREAVTAGAELHRRWDGQMEQWATRNPARAADLRRVVDRGIPGELNDSLPRWEPGTMVSTRDASRDTIQVLAEHLPELVGGSADLADPNRTAITSSGSFLPEDGGRTGRNVHWGVREFAMAAAVNGMVLAGGTRVFAGTFLTFSDYERAALRLAALMKLPSIFVWSHDSIALGQDGPTHQPIEHLASLRAMPGFTSIRPADANETAAAWFVALEQDGPAGLVLCRQPLKTLGIDPDRIVDGVRRGAYIVSSDSTADDPDVILIGTGSELELAVDAATTLRGNGYAVRVVSMPSRDLFDRQDDKYRDSVLPPQLRARVVVEAAATFGWGDIIGDAGVAVGIDHFGESGPATDVQRACGMTAERVVAAADEAMSRSRK
ncbi:Transketolase [Corynebacterium glyciniphilum AJ 3170]|uniref:Transketolase n=1 Tax=Corynebacterium glyciniphilum AJ 3170 TaxID=1404245 RepID=X5EDI1_9CORY|nr:transketolase [Corynebacterium glyciniphilum]AHW64671.1 Transketolase [Corynebacterium glyciniphilum AJ 3170]